MFFHLNLTSLNIPKVPNRIHIFKLLGSLSKTIKSFWKFILTNSIWQHTWRDISWVEHGPTPWLRSKTKCLQPPVQEKFFRPAIREHTWSAFWMFSMNYRPYGVPHSVQTHCLCSMLATTRKSNYTNVDRKGSVTNGWIWAEVLGNVNKSFSKAIFSNVYLDSNIGCHCWIKRRFKAWRMFCWSLNNIVKHKHNHCRIAWKKVSQMTETKCVTLNSFPLSVYTFCWEGVTSRFWPSPCFYCVCADWIRWLSPPNDLWRHLCPSAKVKLYVTNYVYSPSPLPVHFCASHNQISESVTVADQLL